MAIVKKSFSLLISLLLTFSCYAKQDKPLYNKTCSELRLYDNYNNDHKLILEKKIIFPKSKNPQGIIFSIHGLNNRPGVLDEFLNSAADLNFITYRFGLSGHGKSLQEMKLANRTQWENDFYRAYCDLKRITTEHKDLPVYLVAYSLGALVYGSLSSKTVASPISFQKNIFFAPAFTPRWYTKTVKAFNLLGGQFIIKSLTPPAYRAHPGTSVNAYRALFQMSDNLIKDIKNKVSIPKFMDDPTLIFFNSTDPLVGEKSLKRIYQKRKTVLFSKVDVSNSELKKSNPHLIIDQKAVGKKQWQKIIEKSKRFLLDGLYPH